MKDVLSDWEKEAAPFALLNDFNALRVMALISLIRKKDEKLQILLTQADKVSGGLGAGMSMLIRKALALTEELK